MSKASPLVRMVPLQPSELPQHPLLSSTDSETNKRPDLLHFALALLDQTSNALHPTSFNLLFKSHSHKPAPPSNTEVEVLTATISSDDLAGVKWDDPDLTAGVGRIRPREIPTEHWCARRSYHVNTSSKINPATASWPEFVFGLRNNHSKNEHEFTPTLYDARHILDWNTELDEVAQKWNLGQQSEAPGKTAYSNITLAVYEMCHEVPFPLQPRCFPVLVATASTSDTQFIAVTVPVNLTSFEGSFYSIGKNRTEGETSLRKKQVVLGVYTAVEKCELISRQKEQIGGDAAGGAQTEVEKEELIEWIMGTASDAKGNLPMMMQKSSLPSMVPKDVGYFLKWINKVDESNIKNGTAPWATGNGTTTEGGRSRAESSASRQMLSSARSSIEKAASLAPS